MNEELKSLGISNGNVDGSGSRFLGVSSQGRAEEGRMEDEKVEGDHEADLFGADDDGREGGVRAPEVRLVGCMEWVNCWTTYDRQGSVGDFWSWAATAFEAILGGLEEVVGDSESLNLAIKAFMFRILGLMVTWTFCRGERAVHGGFQVEVRRRPRPPIYQRTNRLPSNQLIRVTIICKTLSVESLGWRRPKTSCC